ASAGPRGSCRRGPGFLLLPLVLLDLGADLGHVELADGRDEPVELGGQQHARLGVDEDVLAERMIVGIDLMPKAIARSCCTSVSTLPKTMSGWASDAASKIGPNMRH